MRTVLTGKSSDVPERIAREIAQVGALAWTSQLVPGDRINLRGTPAIILRQITHAEFMVMVLASGLLDTEAFAAMPQSLYFYAISVD